MIHENQIKFHSIMLMTSSHCYVISKSEHRASLLSLITKDGSEAIGQNRINSVTFVVCASFDWQTRLMNSENRMPEMITCGAL